MMHLFDLLVRIQWKPRCGDGLEEMQQVEQPAWCWDLGLALGEGVVVFSSQWVISFSTDAELDPACVRVSYSTVHMYSTVALGCVFPFHATSSLP